MGLGVLGCGEGALGSVGQRLEGASSGRCGARLSTAPCWPWLGITGCLVSGVTREVGNPGMGRVLEAEKGAQGAAVEVRCCPGARAVREPGLGLAPRSGLSLA